MEEMAERCAVSSETEELDRGMRVLIHGRKNWTYKIYF